MPTVNGFNTTQGILKYNAEKLENYNTPEFNSSTTYSLGDYVIHDGKLYKYTSNTPSSGSWNVSNWTFIVLTDEIKTLFNDVSNIEDNIPEASDTNPLMDGIVSAGVSDNFSRADHIHPKDTSKQDKLTFDNSPTQNSINPVTSGGVYTALSGKQDTLTFDNTPTEDSDNPVKSGGIYESILNLYPIDTASGSIASFPDGADDFPVKDLACTINPAQDLHGLSNPYPSAAEKVPYNFRTSGGASHSDVVAWESDKLIGGTVAWNQLIRYGDFAAGALAYWFQGAGDTESYSYSSLSVSNNILTQTYLQDTTQGYKKGLGHSLASAKTIGHKYLVSFEANYSFLCQAGLIGMTTNPVLISNTTVGAWKTYACVATAETASTYLDIAPYETVGASGTIIHAGDTVQFRNFCLFDLTQMFGSAIADYISTLETNNKGAGVAFFRKLFPKPYYDYIAGSLKSVQTSAHKTVGFNAWDEEWEVGGLGLDGTPTIDNTKIRSKNYIPVIAGATYYCKTPNSSTYAVFFDANKTSISSDYTGIINTTFTVPANAAFMKIRVGSGTNPITTYNHDICINLHWDGGRNGEYKPYVQHTYALDSDLILRGIPKLDANNSLYYDGDEYASDGTVTRKRALVTGEWKKSQGLNHVFYRNGLGNKQFGLTTMSTAISNLLPTVMAGSLAEFDTMDYGVRVTDIIYAVNKDCSTAEEFNTWATNKGLQVEFELATPTTESADAFENPQEVNPYGTEEYVDSRSVPIPVGHSTIYGNICPISGFSSVNVTRIGKNVLDVSDYMASRDPNNPSSQHGIFYYLDANNRTIHFLSGTTDSNTWIYINRYSAIGEYNFNFKPGTYILTTGITGGSGTGYRVQLSVYDKDTNVYKRSYADIGSGVNVTINDNETEAVYLYIPSGKNMAGVTISPMLRVSSDSDATYEPYKGNTYTIALGQTVYGGTLDVTSGTLTVTHTYLDMGAVDWVYNSSQTWFSTAARNGKAVENGDVANAYCSAYSVKSRNYLANNPTENYIFAINATPNVIVRNLGYTDADAFKASMNGQMVVYELATPIEISLTPTQISTLLGQNNIWHDANGETSVIFRADPTLFVNTKIMQAVSSALNT